MAGSNSGSTVWGRNVTPTCKQKPTQEFSSPSDCTRNEKAYVGNLHKSIADFNSCTRKTDVLKVQVMPDKENRVRRIPVSFLLY